MRVVDPESNVLKQNTDMTKMTEIDANSGGVKCHEQLSSPDCQTEACPLNQLQKDTEKNELRYGDSEVIVREVTRKLPTGETKHLSMVAEQITDESGEVTGIIQSFKDMTEIKQS